MKNALDEAAASYVKTAGNRPENLVCGQQHPGQPDRGRCSRRCLCLGRSRLDGLPRTEKPDPPRDACQPAQQQDRAGCAKNEAKPIAIGPGLDLSSMLGSGRLAMGNVDAVPAGKYGRAALEKLGVWDRVKGRIAQADNVRGALLLVSRGEAPLGIVYQPMLRRIPTSPSSAPSRGQSPTDHLSRGDRPRSWHPDAPAFLTYLRGDGARGAFEKQGFTVL